ncbi:hypothetical protein WL283_03945 [Staphylococcus epidermidis]|uniref:hypothetical protein n=1 Tax=Staphylococcus epidermidis TaxID=1282 RepID=UPI0030BEB1D7
MEFLYVCKKIIDILVALATIFEEKTTKLLVKITKKEKKVERDIYVKSSSQRTINFLGINACSNPFI